METKIIKPKKATVTKIEHTYVQLQVICPHCHTELIGGFGENTLMLACFHCKKPIDLRS